MLVQTTPPATEPVTLAQARLQLKLTPDDPTTEDGLITGVWIPAARRHAEMVTARSLITQSWRLTLACFPPVIELERGPVQKIDSIVYRDTGGTTRTVAWALPSSGIQRSTDGSLVADLTAAPALIAPAFGCVWPTAISELGAVAVNYTAGYGDTDVAVPEGIKQWMLLRIGSADQNREEITKDRVMALPHVDAMLDPYSIVQP